MAKSLDKEKPKIMMLLDIENVFSESTKGIGKFIITVCVALIPLAIVAYTGLYLYVSWKILLLIQTIWALRTFMIIAGRESARIANFKAQRDDIHALTADMVNIGPIHPQGCIEYMNGTIGFFVVTYNNSDPAGVDKSKQIDRFLNLCVGKHPFDMFFQNITDTTQLDDRYRNVTLFSDSEAANDYMSIIDYNREMVSRCSTLTRNVILVKGRKYQWKEILSDIESALNSESARVFRSAYLVTDISEINDITSRDVNGYIDLANMQQQRYYTGDKYGSKVISYDYSDKKDMAEDKQKEDVALFIPRY